MSTGSQDTLSPLDAREATLMTAYLDQTTAAEASDIEGLLAEMRVPAQLDLGYRRVDVGAGLIIEKRVDRSPAWKQIGFIPKCDHPLVLDDLRNATQWISHVLFEVSWVGAEKGSAWAELYRITWLPQPAVWVLTASFETDAQYGYTDIALGHFKAPTKLMVDKVRPILKRRWRLLKLASSRAPWNHVGRVGIVDATLADCWRSSVWTESATRMGYRHRADAQAGRSSLRRTSR